MIDRRRALELAEHPWCEPFAILAAIVSARTRADFDRLEPKFNAAYRQLKAFVFTRNRYPLRNPDISLDPTAWDRDLATALNRLDWLIGHNPAVFGQDSSPRAHEIACKLSDLRQRSYSYIMKDSHETIATGTVTSDVIVVRTSDNSTCLQRETGV
jgi:hypothetical protein